MGRVVDKSASSNVSFSEPRKPTRAARDLLCLWTSRRRGTTLPPRNDFVAEDLARWSGSLALIANNGGTMHVDIYGPALPGATGIDVSGLWLPNWPDWLQLIGLHTSARLRIAGGPFVERVHRVSVAGPRVYDRIVLPLADAAGRAGFWLSFIDNAHYSDLAGDGR